jgi:PAS domain S-box-containing protein
LAKHDEYVEDSGSQEGSALRRERRAAPGVGADGMPATLQAARDLIRKLRSRRDELQIRVEELLRARDELEESMGHYARLYDSAPAGHVILFSNGDILSVNNKFASMLGVPRAALKQRHFADTVHQSDRRGLDSLLQSCRKQGPVLGELRLTRGDGSTFWVSVQIDRPFEAKPRAPEFAVCVTDVTGRTYTQHALAESEERYRQIIEGASEGIWMMDLEGKTTFVNTQMAEMLGYEPEEMIGRDAFEWVVEDDVQARLDEFERRKKSPGIRRGEFRYWRKDGSVLVAYVSTSRVSDNQGRPTAVMAMFTDITERKSMERQLLALNEKLEDLVAERTAEVEKQAAELRALAAKLGRAQQEERERVAKMLHDHLQQLLVAARIQLGLIREENDWKRTESILLSLESVLRQAIDEARSLVVELSPPALREGGLAGGLRWLAGRMSELNQLDVEVQADGAAEPTRDEIRFMLFDCVRELLLNVVKHSGVRNARVTMSVANGSQCRIVVEDGGRGYDPADVGVQRNSRTGFGLFSIDQRLRHFSGRMEIQTGPGRGAKVSLFMPIVEPATQLERGQDGARYGPEEVDRQAGREKSKIRVLLVDDHEIFREGLAGLLDLEADIQVVGMAADGRQAVEMTSKYRPDLVVMDVNLPGMSGIEATKKILDDMPQTRVIGLSMHIDRDIATAMREAGAVAYLSKDNSSDDLVESIRTYGRPKTS